MRILFGVFSAALLAVPATNAQQIDFGDDASNYANDGECDDKRFEGPGMTTTVLLDSDIGHDATDCRTAFEAGLLSARGDGGAGGSDTATTFRIVDDIDFGDDASQYANDGECDDRRFAGPGMTTTTLLDSDVLHDATDCRSAYEAGKLQLAEDAPGAPEASRSAKERQDFSRD